MALEEEEKLFSVKNYEHYGEKKDVLKAMINDHGIFVTDHPQQTNLLNYKGNILSLKIINVL